MKIARVVEPEGALGAARLELDSKER